MAASPWRAQVAAGDKAARLLEYGAVLEMVRGHEGRAASRGQGQLAWLWGRPGHVGIAPEDRNLLETSKRNLVIAGNDMIQYGNIWKCKILDNFECFFLSKPWELWRIELRKSFKWPQAVDCTPLCFRVAFEETILHGVLQYLPVIQIFQFLSVTVTVGDFLCLRLGNWLSQIPICRSFCIVNWWSLPRGLYVVNRFSIVARVLKEEIYVSLPL